MIRREKLRNPLFFNVALALLVWLVWYYYTTPDAALILDSHWPISLTMVFGSLIAGATSEGGGAIAFPVFTKVLHIAPQDAKIFSLAIQSVGMTAASMTIWLMRVKIVWPAIVWGSIGGVPGVVFGAAVLAPVLAPDRVKMLFTAMLTSFAVTLAILNWGHRIYNKSLASFEAREKMIMLVTGALGGMMSGLVGSGIDIICFSVLVLLFRVTEKVATPTSVVLMGVNSVVGFLLHVCYLGGFTQTVQNYWLAAVPVVVVGAPLGACICTRMQNHTIINLLIFIILIELVSSLLIIPLSLPLILSSVAVFLFFSTVYYVLSKITLYLPNNKEKQKCEVYSKFY